MDYPYRVEPSVRSANRPPEYLIMTSREGELCRTPDQVFAHRLVDLLNADEATRRDGTRRQDRA